MLGVNVRLTDDHVRAMRRLGKTMRQVQQDLIHKLALDVVGEVMDRNRVYTGRSRMGWSAVPRRLGGSFRPGGGTPGALRRKGQAPSAAEEAGARQEGARGSRLRRRDRRRQGEYEVSVENPIWYVEDLERRYPFVGPSVTRQVRRFRGDMRRALRDLGRA